MCGEMHGSKAFSVLLRPKVSDSCLQINRNVETTDRPSVDANALRCVMMLWITLRLRPNESDVSVT